MNCPKCKSEMGELLSPIGVLVDVCRGCQGMWFDKGEVSFFAKEPKRLMEAISHAASSASPTTISCPRCSARLSQMAVDGLEIEGCEKCSGLYLDAGEMAKLNEKLSEAVKSGKMSKSSVSSEDLYSRMDKPLAAASLGGSIITRENVLGMAAAALPALPSLALRTTCVFGALSGLLLLAMFAATQFAGAPAHIALLLTMGMLLLQFLISPWIMDFTLRWTMSLKWVEPQELPSHLRNFVANVAGEHQMKFPRFGIIADGTPNAFTYGHTPKNARIVITQGLMDLLEEKELEAVVGHEMGHAVHWDIAVMTLASAIPVILYYLFRMLWQAAARVQQSRNKNAGQAAMPMYVAAILAYISYVIAQYIVLYLSRVREFWADRFSGEVTKNPNHLSMALVKIAYGLAGKSAERAGAETKRNAQLESMAAMGIFEKKGALGLVTTALSRGGGMNMGNVTGAMQWDLWNPWAGWYEFHSSHPLPAKRIFALGRQAMTFGKQPLVEFNLQKPESYWDEFFVDILMKFLPWIFAALGAFAAFSFGIKGWPLFGALLAGWGLGNLISARFSYQGHFFPEMEVASLLKQVKVSGIRGVPCKLKGKIIGRGVPGYILSEDLVLQDETGYIFLDYRQPLAIWELLFGLFRAKGIIGQEVEVEGYYRRAPVPFVEMYSLKTPDGKVRRCYVSMLKILFSVLAMGVGLALAFVL